MNFPKPSLERNITLGFCAILLALVLIGIATWINAARAKATALAVSRTHEVQFLLESTLTHVLDLQTGTRGFALTGEPGFLEAHADGGEKARQALAALRTLIVDGPAQQQRLGELTTLVNQAEEIMTGRIAARREGGLTAAAEPAALNAGKEAIDRIRLIITEMQGEEQRLLQKYSARTEAATRLTMRIVTAGGVIAALCVVISAVVVRRDLRARQRNAATLEKSRATFIQLFEGAADGFVVVDRQGRILRVNAQIEKLFGWTRGELAGRPIDVLMPARFRARHGGHLAAYFAAPRSRAMGAGLELLGERKDGSEFPIDIMLSPLETAEGTQALAVVRDITERKQTDDTLRKSQQMFQRLFENAPDATLLVDGAGRIVRVNMQTENLFGWTRDELVGRPVDVLLPERLRARHGAHLIAYFAAPRTRAMGAGLELFGRRKDDSEFPVDIMLSPLETDGGTQALAVIRDITLRKADEAKINQLNSGLRQQNAQLEAANKELEGFTYTVSHDLRAPLRHIDGFSGMLQKHAAGLLDEKGVRYLNTISEAAKQMGRLIDALLAFSRLGRVAFTVAPVDQNQLVADILRNGRFHSPARPIDWQVAPLPPASGDAATLRQVWTNLIDNAVKYSSEKPQPRIEIGGYTDESTGEHVFYVRDNGAGFDMQYVGKLFGVFQRLHTGDEFEGVGVGLANVRRIITRHGGRTWAEGKPGEGATFYFSLPHRRA